MARFSTCACGNPADSFGGQCDRCLALQTLSLGISASQDQIEDMYHTLVKIWHPDRFGSDPSLRLTAEEKIKEINAAHDYLSSASSPAVRNPQKMTGSENPREAGPLQSALLVEQQEDVLDPQRKSSASRLILNTIRVVGFVAVIALLCFSLDLFLSSNQATASGWARSKAELSHDVHAGAALLSSSGSAPSTPAEEQGQDASTPPRTRRAGSPEQEGKSSRTQRSERTVTAMPYVTAGLTPMEVISILGNPTSSSGEKMLYKGTEIDFEHGEVAGWKIDAKSAPIRVKLWPDEAPVPGLTTFGVGSSKSDVVALQGTPSLFSSNEFGYGGSVVFFQNDHVVGWKEDPASVRLKVAH